MSGLAIAAISFALLAAVVIVVILLVKLAF